MAHEPSPEQVEESSWFKRLKVHIVYTGGLHTYCGRIAPYRFIEDEDERDIRFFGKDQRLCKNCAMRFIFDKAGSRWGIR